MSRRFCMVTSFYPPYNFGGDGVYVRRLVEALAGRGHEVHVIHDADAYRLMAGGEPEGGYRDADGVVHHALRHGPLWRLDLLAAHQAGRPLATAGRLRELLSADFDVVHFHNISLIGGPAVLRLDGGVKLCTLHDYWFVCPMHTLWRMGREACSERTCLRCTLHGRRPPQLWRRTAGFRRAMAAVDTFVVPSEFSRETHLANGLEGRVEVLPNFAPPAGAGAAAEPSPRPAFLCVARLERLKGVQDLIEAFRSFEDADLLIAGRGGYEPELRRRAEGLAHVRFLGWRSQRELESLYRQAVALLVPSLCYESAFPLVGIEAFSVGTPVLARRIGALEQLETLGGGWLFEDVEDLRRQLGRLLDADEEVAAAAATARRLYEREFSEAVHLERYLGLIDELERGGPAEAAL